MQWVIDLVKTWLQVYLRGMIVIWSGTLATIPDGWALCDGTNGTPNLKNKFIRGAYNIVPPGSTGGTIDHRHDFTTDGHLHNIPSGPQIPWGDGYDHATDSQVDTGTTDSEVNLPPYYSLAFIMKL